MKSREYIARVFKQDRNNITLYLYLIEPCCGYLCGTFLNVDSPMPVNDLISRVGETFKWWYIDRVWCERCHQLYVGGVGQYTKDVKLVMTAHETNSMMGELW